MEHCLWLIASLAAGEAPLELMGPEAFQAVIWTMRNRMELWNWPCERLPSAYFGWRSPTSAEMELTNRTLKARDDPTGGALFCLSREDRKRWRLREGDLVFRRKGYELHLYRGNPWK